ncbi:DUF6036 family nucleotidyltransferase [Vagococcus fluvialis]|uniref:DUF6036 family nucleotidyltransferase n=1 Tax=Vagococcus fluvialis TaxID=2738 RepID=UPI003B593312
MDNNKAKEFLNSQLEILNQDLFERDAKADLVLIGGFAAKYLLEEFRPTIDLDFMVGKLVNETPSSFNELLENNGMEAVTVVEIPPIEEIEFHETLRYSNLTVSIPTIEYLAISKIFTTRQKDEDDLVDEKLLAYCDPELLSEMLIDYKGFVLNPQNPDLNFNSLKNVFDSYGIKY